MTTKATLTRDPSTPEGTFGLLTTEGGAVFHSLELPWVDVNRDGIGDPQRSCITPGTYICKWHRSPKYGMCYEVTGVKGRSHILIHPANLAGDVDAGWQSQLLGCIALGEGISKITNKHGKLQKCITSSRDAIKRFHDWANERDIELTVRWKA